MSRLIFAIIIIAQASGRAMARRELCRDAALLMSRLASYGHHPRHGRCTPSTRRPVIGRSRTSARARGFIITARAHNATQSHAEPREVASPPAASFHSSPAPPISRHIIVVAVTARQRCIMTPRRFVDAAPAHQQRDSRRCRPRLKWEPCLRILSPRRFLVSCLPSLPTLRGVSRAELSVKCHYFRPRGGRCSQRRHHLCCFPSSTCSCATGRRTPRAFSSCRPRQTADHMPPPMI